MGVDSWVQRIVSQPDKVIVRIGCAQGPDHANTGCRIVGGVKSRNRNRQRRTPLAGRSGGLADALCCGLPFVSELALALMTCLLPQRAH